MASLQLVLRLFCVQLVLSCASAQSTTPVEVVTQYGTVRGQVVPVFNGMLAANVNTFYSIPFAKPPVGSLRFRAPQPPDNFGSVFLANKPGPACIQSACCTLWVTHPFWNDFSEDCLNLNIFAPSEPNPQVLPLPVMVWFFGGAFQSGANFQYPGHFMAAYDIVVVTVNYRLNKFGFASTGDDTVDSNGGMLDQLAALEYVRDNIAAFGGDPNKVTIFGQSAGAGSSSLQMVSPKSRGLFHQAIMESGTDYSFWTLNPPPSNPDQYIVQVAQQVNCPTNTNENMMTCLRSKPWADIRNTNITCTEGYFCLGMVPVVDGPGGFMPDYPSVVKEEIGFFTGNMITGITRDDGSFYTTVYIPESLEGGFNRTDYLHYMQTRLLDFWSESFDAYTVDHLLKALDYNYSPWPYINDEYLNRDAINEMVTDAAFGTAWDIQAKAYSDQGATVYTYVFDWRSPNAVNIIPEWVGVPHMGELPYVWGYPLLQLNPDVRLDSEMVFDIIDWNDDDIYYTIYWQRMYANFAKFGNPTPLPVDNPFGGGTTNWEPFTFTNMSYLYAAREPYVAEGWRQQDYAFWKYYMPSIVGVGELPAGDITQQSQNAKGREHLRMNIPDHNNEQWKQLLKTRLEEFTGKLAKK